MKTLDELLVEINDMSEFSVMRINEHATFRSEVVKRLLAALRECRSQRDSYIVKRDASWNVLTWSLARGHDDELVKILTEVL